jgi:hypothetical protein
MEDFNDFEFDDDFRDEIMELIKEANMQEDLEEIKLKLANENYNAIISKGIDVDAMIRMGVDIEPIKKTLQQMLDLFQDLEEYEKCANILKYIKELE